MQRSVVVVASFALAQLGCSDAITLSIASDRPIPSGIDSICVGIADTSASGGSFGRNYRLEGALAVLPQTLRVEPGEAASAYAWVRGDRAGVPVVRAGAGVSFDDDVTLDMLRCERGGSGAPAMRGMVGPGDAKLAASQGANGQLVVAVAAGMAVVIDADAELVTTAAPASDGNALDVISVDFDRDCDDDIVVVTDSAPPALWRRTGVAFEAIGTLGDAPMAALAAADVDRDGSIDVVTGQGATLALWRNDGSGGFARDDQKLVAGGRVASVRALALGDLDGDGNPDLVVGQGGDPLVAWLGDPGGTGQFAPSPAAVPPVPLDVRTLALVDADDDLDPDLFVALAAAPPRLYIARDGRLEDQSFVRLMAAPADATAFAVGGWDASCEPDVVIAAPSGSLSLRGQPTGAFAMEAAAASATDVAMLDLDDNGTLDVVLATPEGVQWLAR